MVIISAISMRSSSPCSIGAVSLRESQPTVNNNESNGHSYGYAYKHTCKSGPTAIDESIGCSLIRPTRARAHTQRDGAHNLISLPFLSPFSPLPSLPLANLIDGVYRVCIIIVLPCTHLSCCSLLSTKQPDLHAKLRQGRLFVCARVRARARPCLSVCLSYRHAHTSEDAASSKSSS